MGRIVAISLSLALIAGATGCTGVSSEERAVQDAVRAYNEALSVAFAHMDMNKLQGTATEEQADNDAVMMQSLGSGGVRMISTLTSLKFGDVTFPAQDTAQVTTTEVWAYRHESLETSQTVRSEQGVVYHLRYDLVLENGHWLVSGVTSLDDEGTSQETTAR